MGTNGRRTVHNQMHDRMVAPLADYFAALGMGWVSEIVRSLNPENDVMGVTTVSTRSASEALRRWKECTPQGKHMAAVLVTGINSGSFMQMPQDYNPNSAHAAEWVAKHLSKMDARTRTQLEHDAVALVVAAGSVMESFKEGLEEDDDEQIH
jgi:hypothetical protein